MKTRSFAGSEDAVPTGVICPKCRHNYSICTDSRPNANGTRRRRRRKCKKCAYKFSTLEVVVGEGTLPTVTMTVLQGRIIMAIGAEFERAST